MPAASLLSVVVLLVLLPSVACAQADPFSMVRRDHPRLFFSNDTWPAVKARAEGPLAEQLAKVRAHGAGKPGSYEWSRIQRPATRPGSPFEARDYGQILMSAAFAYRLAPAPADLERIRGMLWASLDYYHACTAQKRAVDWYAMSRIGWIAALDWCWNDLAPAERGELAVGMLRHVTEVTTTPGIQRRNGSDHTTGFYGDTCLPLFIGLLLHREGLADKEALAMLQQGRESFEKLLAYRSQMAGDDGGSAAPTVGYSFDAYPWAEWNYLHCWQAATGEDLSGKWPYLGMFANYVLWNMLPGLLEYGFGDTPHKDNRLPRWWMYTHMSEVMHWYGRSRPELAALAAYTRGQFPVHFEAGYLSIYPFLLTGLEQAPPPLSPGKLPAARFFPNMGQLFMRSGDGPKDTYCLLSAGGLTGQHRHYDAGHFTIYRQGFLALDTGTREGNTDNLQNYFAQTIAHNTLLIKLPGEKPSPYWNGAVRGQAGGQDKQVGSQVTAFETGPVYTYAAVDLTPVYNAAKCRQAVRQFLFLPPDHFVVFDRVVATQAGYAKTWLLHTANEPTLKGLAMQADQGEGRLFCQTLLPADATVAKVGGPGQEFLVEGVNYAITAGPAAEIAAAEYTGARKLDYKEVPELMGRWRLEVKPGAPREQDLFLHLLQVGDKTLQAMAPGTVTTEPGRAILSFEAHGAAVTVTFATSGAIGGHLRVVREGQALADSDLATGVMAQEALAAAR